MGDRSAGAGVRAVSAAEHDTTDLIELGQRHEPDAETFDFGPESHYTRLRQLLMKALSAGQIDPGAYREIMMAAIDFGGARWTEGFAAAKKIYGPQPETRDGRS